MTEMTSNKAEIELTRFLFQSDNAKGCLGILTMASHWFMHTSMETVIFTTRKTGLVPSVKGLCTVNRPWVTPMLHIISDVMCICVV